MKNNGVKVRLLPKIYRKIGWGVIAVTLLFYILCSVVFGESKHIEDYILLAKSISVVGFLFVMLAREEIEDERTVDMITRLFAGLFVGLVGSYIFTNLQIVAHSFIGHKFTIDFNYFIFCVAFFIYLLGCKEQEREELGLYDTEEKKILGMSSKECRTIIYIFIFCILYTSLVYILPYFKL